MKPALIVIAIVLTYLLGYRGGQMDILRSCYVLEQFYVYTYDGGWIPNKNYCSGIE